MAVTRQDSWSQEDDMILATIVINYIETGKTQLEAFEVVGEQLRRTPAACGFRWNSFVRKQYTNAIRDAKAVRMEIRSKQPSFKIKRVDIEERATTINDVIKSLVLIKQNLNNLNQENIELREKIASNNTISNDDVKKMYSVLQQMIKHQENEKEMPTG